MSDDAVLHDQRVLPAIHRLVHTVRQSEDCGRDLPLEELVERARTQSADRDESVDIHATCALGPPMVIVRLAAQEGCRPGLAELSRRENEVAALLADGLNNKEIARRLFISVATVKDHVHRILTKTGLPNRAAVAAAYRVGSVVRPIAAAVH
jgi:DNA-binding NarL/FixJ family response regulator